MLITQCPDCHSLFRVSQGQLKLAEGRVRCGACLRVFDAREQALDSSEPTQTASEHTFAPSSRPAVAKDNRAPSPLTDQTASSLASIPQLEIVAEPIVLRSEIGDATHPMVVLGWFLGCVLALTGLLGQYLWFERSTLANDPNLYALYTLTCEHLPCALNTTDGLKTLEVERVILRPHPQFADLISLSIKIHNQALFDQPYPAVEVSFSDVKSNLITRRTFEPSEYLTADQWGTPLKSGHDLEINLPLTDPGETALSYAVELR